MRSLERQTRTLFLAVALCLGGPNHADAEQPDEPEIRWREKSLVASTLPEDMPGATKRAIEAWISWAREAEYRLDVEASGRVLVLSRANNRSIDHQMELVQRTIDAFDAAFPRVELSSLKRYASPTRANSDDEPSTAEPSDDAPLPEDPDGGTPPWELEGYGPGKREEPEPTTSVSVWGAENIAPDTETTVFLILWTESEYRSVLERLRRDYPYLAKWARSAAKQQGFALQHPLAGAYIEQASGQEEWHPDGELVNRIAQLLMLRRFGWLPNWFVQGAAWWLEFAVRGEVYCFPYRDEFVSSGDHTDWDRQLARYFKRRTPEKKPLIAREFASWKRGRYDNTAAKISWGLVDYLSRFAPDELPRLALAFGEFWREDNRIEHDDGTWERNRDYDVPTDVQADLLTLYAGPTFWVEATRFFREGDDYRPAR